MWPLIKTKGMAYELEISPLAFYRGLLGNPGSYGYYDKPVRQGKIERFPYVVVFEIFDELVLIYSVFMTRQDPDKKRLG